MLCPPPTDRGSFFVSVHYHESEGLFVLETARTVYQMKVDGAGVLRHLYYGIECGHEEM